MIEVEALASSVAERVAAEGQRDDLLKETVRIARQEPGSGHLMATEIITLAGLVVQVCVIAVESAKLAHGFNERSKYDQFVKLMERLAERSGDPAAKDNAEVKLVAAAVIDVLTDGQPTLQQQMAQPGGAEAQVG